MSTDEQRKAEGERAIAWLGKHWKQPQTCPICRSNNWQVGIVSELRGYNGGDLVLGGPDSSLMPIVPVVCTTCGYVFSFSAILSGTIEPRAQAQDD